MTPEEVLDEHLVWMHEYERRAKRRAVVACSASVLFSVCIVLAFAEVVPTWVGYTACLAFAGYGLYLMGHAFHVNLRIARGEKNVIP